MADLIQPVRPDVDAFVLELLDKRTFRASVFAETRSGVCKILAPLTHELAESASRSSTAVGTVTEQVAVALAKMTDGTVRRVSTPITQRSRAAAARQSFRGGTRKPARTRKIAPTCRSCGGPTPRRTTSVATSAALQSRPGRSRFSRELELPLLAWVRQGGWTPLGLTGLTKFVGAHEAQKAAFSWENGHDRPKQSCYYASL